MNVKRLTVACTSFFLAGVLALAQTSTSELSGTVRDNSGGLVPGAEVTLANE
jgi:hypothetical protein